MNEKKAIIIGSGLGGLLTGAFLSKSGWCVKIYEQLSIVGGRFSNIEYKGYQLSTGALHMAPNGSNGPLARMLKELGAHVEIVQSNPMATIRIPKNLEEKDYSKGFTDINHIDFTKHMSFKNKFWMAILTLGFRLGLIQPKKIPFDTWFSKYIDDERIVLYADCFTGWSLSLKANEVPAEEMFEILNTVTEYGGPGLIKGGCSSVVNELVRIIEENGGKVYKNREVVSVNTLEKCVKSVTFRETSRLDMMHPELNPKDETEEGDLFISNIGHVETAELCSKNEKTHEKNGNGDFEKKYTEYIQKLKDIRASAGLKICFAADEPLIGHNGILLTPYTRRVCGMNEITSVDPTMAPPGKHLIMAHQRMALDKTGKKEDIEKEIEYGLNDLKELFPGKNLEILAVQVHRDRWPVNRCFSGHDIGNKTPYSNLYIVGDGAKGRGGIEIEGITLGVRKTLDEIQKMYK